MKRNCGKTSSSLWPRRIPAIVLVLAALLAGCSGQEVSSPPKSDATAVAQQLSPAEFAQVIDSGDRFVLNVHTPDEGSLPGTDGAIPFDEIENRVSELPRDHATPLALYCQTGRMSRDAAKTLATLGYTDVVELRGGMVAWQADGRRLLAPGS